MKLIFAWKVLKKEPDITEEDGVQHAAFTFVNTMEELDVKRCIFVWEMPAGFFIMQTFLLHICYQLSTYCMEYSLYE